MVGCLCGAADVDVLGCAHGDDGVDYMRKVVCHGLDGGAGWRGAGFRAIDRAGEDPASYRLDPAAVGDGVAGAFVSFALCVSGRGVGGHATVPHLDFGVAWVVARAGEVR